MAGTNLNWLQEHERKQVAKAHLSVSAQNVATYVAEIDAEAILAFRAEDDEAARRFLSGSRFQHIVRGYSGLLRFDGRVLWDGKSPIRHRLATAQEHWLWVTLRSSLKGQADDPGDWIVYLVPVLDNEAKP
jgi:hypothetical protein